MTCSPTYLASLIGDFCGSLINCGITGLLFAFSLVKSGLGSKSFFGSFKVCCFSED